MDLRNFTIEELDFLEGVQKDIECFTRQEVEIRIKYGMQEEIDAAVEEEIEDETEEKIKKLDYPLVSIKKAKYIYAEEVEEEIEDETEEKIKKLDYPLVSIKKAKYIYAEEVEEEIEDETEEKIKELDYALVSMKKAKYIYAEEVEEEIEDETEEKIKELDYKLVSMKKAKSISAEEVEEEIDEELYSSNYDEFEESSSCDVPLSDLQKDKAAKAALENEMRIRRAETEMKEAQRRKRKENPALSNASKKEQVEKYPTAHLRRSEKDQKQRYAKPQKQIRKMTADLKDKDGQVEKFKAELKGNCEVNFEEQKTSKELKQAYEDLSKMKRKFLEQDNEIKSLQAKHYKLQEDYEAALSQQQRDKEELIHLTCKNQQLALEQKRPQGEPKDDHKRQRAQDNQSTLKFKQEQGKNNKLQKDLEVALSQQHKDKEELMLLTSENQKLALELKTLRGELKDDHKRQRAQDNQWTLKFKQEQSKYNKLQNDLEVALSQQQKDREKLMLMPYKNQNLLKLEQKRLRGELENDVKRELAQDNQWTLKFKQEQGKNNKLQKDLEVALSQQHKDKEELMLLTCKIQKLALELERVRGELKDDPERELALNNQWTLKLKQEQGKYNKLQEDYEAALSQQHKDKEELMLLTSKNHQLALDKKRLQVELEDVQLKRELSLIQLKKDRDTCNMLEEKLQKYKTRLLREIKQNEQQKKATESKLNDMQTPSMENEDIVAKFEAKDRSESTKTLAQLEDALHKEKVQSSILEERTIQIASALERERERANKMFSALERERERANQSSSALEREQEKDYRSSFALEKERARLDKYRVELKEGLMKPKKEQTNVLLRQPDELRLNEQQRAQHNPQRQHTDLGRKHKEINSNFHELRIPPPTSRTTKSRSALQKGRPAHHSVGLSRTQKVHHSV